VVGGIAILLALGLTGGLYLHGHQSAVAQQAELALKLQLAEAMNKLDQSNSKDAEQLGRPRQAAATAAGRAGRVADPGAGSQRQAPQ
jgi:uncharacterized protein HemX